MKNIINKIKRWALPFGVAGAILTECASTNSIPTCDGGNLVYKNLQVLAQGNEGQKLMKIDGRFYIGDEEGLINYYNSKDVKNVVCLQGKNKKVLIIEYNNRDVLNNVWENDTFHKEHIIK